MACTGTAEVSPLKLGAPAVDYATGTMAGAWLDGTPFTGVRFCDRLVLRNGLLVEMQVWNDLAEIRPR